MRNAMTISQRIRRWSLPLIVSVALTSTASVAVGQTTEGALDGTLLKARTSGEVAVG